LELEECSLTVGFGVEAQIVPANFADDVAAVADRHVAVVDDVPNAVTAAVAPSEWDTEGRFEPALGMEEQIEAANFADAVVVVAHKNVSFVVDDDVVDEEEEAAVFPHTDCSLTVDFDRMEVQIEAVAHLTDVVVALDRMVALVDVQEEP
jgi:hypothetical protein